MENNDRWTIEWYTKFAFESFGIKTYLVVRLRVVV